MLFIMIFMDYEQKSSLT